MHWLITLSLDEMHFTNSYENCMRYLYILDDVCKTLSKMKDEKTGKEIDSATHYTDKFNQLYKLLEQRVGMTSAQ